jgi:hypothetical protein
MHLTKLTTNEIKHYGLDPHAIKKEWRPNIDMGKLDLFKDEDGNIRIANSKGDFESSDIIQSA